MTPTIIIILDYFKIFFTLFRSNKPVVKSYKADFTKQIAANMYQAGYYLQSLSSLKEFDDYLNSLSSNDTITLGVTQQTSGLSLTAKDFRDGKDCIYRGKEHIKFCNDVYPNPQNLSLLLFDIDYDEAMPEHFKLDTPQEVRKSLIKLFPLLADVSMLIRASSSAGIHNSLTGEKRSQHNSYHVYIVVANSTAETNKSFLDFIKRRAWRSDVNLAYAKVTGAGVVERYYIDLAVLNSAERLIVESAPILEVPLAKEVIPSVIYDGGALDLDSIDCNLEPDYRDIYATEKANLMATVTPTETTNNTIVKTPLASINPAQNEGPIFISESAKAKVIDIYMYLQNTQKPETKGVKAILDDEVTSAVVTFLGYDIDSNYKFKLRAEKTPSCSISHNGYIKDFGGDFAGGIIDFIMHVFDVDFKMSWYYLRACFGQKMPPLPMNLQGVLPAPINFEKRLKVQDNTLGTI